MREVRRVVILPARLRASALFLAVLALVLTCALQASETEIASREAAEDPDTISDARVLADRMLRRQSPGLLLDPERRDRLSQEIGQVLGQLREAYPKTWEVSARMDHRPGMLLVGLKPALLATLALAQRENSTLTGNAEFDALNERLGLSDAQVFRRAGVAALHFAKYVNLETASKKYRKIPGVMFAEPDAQLGDGPDIEVVEVQGIWYVVVRRAWGDCVSGCTHEELSFYSVENGRVHRVEAQQALQEAAFAKLAQIRGWD
ncbi:MAG: hypothetical protein OXG06_00490 [Gammaproteobacteria bacterium]|nr:hypothetical protein [Gammaproteobacteria bacterium]